MAAPKPRRKLTYKDFAKFRDELRRHEVFDGTHLVARAPMVRHQFVAGNLSVDLWTYVPEHKLGHVLIGPIAILPPPRLTADAGDRLATPLLPGLEISLAEVFERDKPFSLVDQRLPGFRPRWAFRYSRR